MLKQIIKQNWQIFLLLAAVVFCVYANSLNNDFVSDDVAGILNNEQIGEFKLGLNFPHNWLWAATYHLFGKNPIPFRIENILFHLANVWLIFILLLIFIRKKTASLLIALIFSAHPILTESITWISGGIYVQYSFFVLLSFLFYLLTRLEKIKKHWGIVLSLLFFVLALSFSEKAIIFPGIIFIFELAFGSLKNNWKKIGLYFLVSLIWFALIFLRIGERAQGLQENFYTDPGAEQPLARIPVAVSYYGQLIFWPEKLSLYQTEMFFSPMEFLARAVITALFLAVIIFLFFKIISKKANWFVRQTFFWLSFFLIALLPTLLAFGLAWIVAERYVYFGSLGIIIVFVLLWHALNEKIFATKKMYWFIGILIVLAIGARTIIRNQDWKNQDTLWIATVKVAPSGQVIHNNLGDMYGRRKQYDKAIKEFLTAIAINPRYADAMHNLANTYLEINNTEQAIYWYNEAIKFGPHLWQSYQNLGMIYYQLGELKKAEELFSRAVEINQNNKNLRDTLEIIRNNRALKL